MHMFLKISAPPSVSFIKAVTCRRIQAIQAKDPPCNPYLTNSEMVYETAHLTSKQKQWQKQRIERSTGSAYITS